MKIMKDYHDLHLKRDVLLLPGVLKTYESYSSHYLSGPALSWGAMLNLINIELELISNEDMYLFLEKDMRGGVSYISRRHSKAKNQESKHII